MQSMALWYDLFLLLVIFFGMLLGFSMGMVRQAINILGLFFGILFASYFHGPVVRWARQVLGETDTFTREAVLFAVIFILIWAFINVGAYYSFRVAPRFLPATLDKVIGMMMGVVTGLLIALITTLLLNYAVSVQWPQNNDLRLAIQQAIDISTLRPFIAAMIPALANMLRPMLPSGLPSFFFVSLG
jgi:uncharacterized membrane protein required for colicin V production